MRTTKEALFTYNPLRNAGKTTLAGINKIVAPNTTEQSFTTHSFE